MVGTLAGGCGCVTAWCDHDLTLNRVKMTNALKSYLVVSVRCRKLILGRDIALGM